MQKIRMLRDFGPNVPPGLLVGPNIGGQAHIYKLRVKSNVQMRPMLSKGPMANDEEVTFLAQALEVGGTLRPATAPETAEKRRQEIIATPQKRRELL